MFCEKGVLKISKIHMKTPEPESFLIKLEASLIIRDHIRTNSNLKVYIHLTEADPETLLCLRCSSLQLESVNYCHKELHLRSARIPGSA